MEWKKNTSIINRALINYVVYHCSLYCCSLLVKGMVIQHSSSPSLFSLLTLTLSFLYSPIHTTHTCNLTYSGTLTLLSMLSLFSFSLPPHSPLLSPSPILTLSLLPQSHTHTLHLIHAHTLCFTLSPLLCMLFSSLSPTHTTLNTSKHKHFNFTYYSHTDIEQGK